MDGRVGTPLDLLLEVFPLVLEEVPLLKGIPEVLPKANPVEGWVANIDEGPTELVDNEPKVVPEVDGVPKLKAVPVVLD